MLQFSLFRIPVAISFWCWIGLLVISGGLYARDASDLRTVILGMCAGLISLLGHEMSHAITSRRLGGGYPVVMLEFLGGFMSNETARFRSKWGSISTIAAGPGFNIALFIFCAIIATSLFTNASVNLNPIEVLISLTLNPIGTSEALLDLGVISQSGVYPTILLGYLLCFNFFWSIFNLLPIWPMDGGQIMAHFVRNPKSTHIISMVASAIIFLLALNFFGLNAILMLLFLGMFFVNNLTAYKSYR